MTEKDKDFLEGVAISVACHVLPVRKVFREPIAYSYNGVILPKLPEWDRGEYPYATIYNRDHEGVYLAMGDKKYTISDSFGYMVRGTSNLRFVLIGNEWIQNDEVAGNFSYPMWANYNLYYSSAGTLYQAASEPIPIYE